MNTSRYCRHSRLSPLMRFYIWAAWLHRSLKNTHNPTSNVLGTGCVFPWDSCQTFISAPPAVTDMQQSYLLDFRDASLSTSYRVGSLGLPTPLPLNTEHFEHTLISHIKRILQRLQGAFSDLLTPCHFIYGIVGHLKRCLGCTHAQPVMQECDSSCIDFLQDIKHLSSKKHTEMTSSLDVETA